MTRTLVTGAAGFTGRYLTSLLAAQGHEVHGVVHQASELSVADAFAVHVADLADPSEIGRVVKDVRPEHVIHLAAIAFVAHDDISELYRTNVVGTRQLLHALHELELAPKSVVIASSANVYGNAREGILSETLLAEPANDYGVSKVAAEYVARLYASRLPIIIARPFNYTGLGQAPTFLIPKIVDHARRRAPVIKLGNLDVARDFSDVRNVVDAYARLLACPAAIGETFNICSGRATSLSDIIELVSELSGHRFDVRIDPSLVRADEVRILLGSAAKLQNVIGDLGDIPLRQTLSWMLAG